MNAKEGMRRLGIVLGVVGGVIGGFFGYIETQNLWNTHTAYRKFESLMALPAVREATKFTTEDISTLQEELLKLEQAGDPRAAKVMAAQRSIIVQLYRDRSQLPPEKAAIVEELARWFGIAQQGTTTVQLKDGTEIELQGDLTPEEVRDRVAQLRNQGRLPTASESDRLALDKTKMQAVEITVSVNLEGIKAVSLDKTGTVSSIELSTGETVHRTEPPALQAYLFPLFYPVIGFLLPWGAIRVLTWVGTGFVEAPRP